MCDLSCIVPVSRMATRLENLRSWIKESCNFDLEIIIVHDKQEHQTGQELQEIICSANNKKIKFIESYFGSPGLARNKGLEVSGGKWISFWDSDDLPQLNEAMQSIKEYPDADVIVGRYKVWDHGTNTEKCISKSQLDFWGIGENPGIWRMIFRKDVLNGLSFGATRLAEDQVFISQINLGSKKTVFTERFLYIYNTGLPQQLTNATINIYDLTNSFVELLASKRMLEKNKNSLSLIMASRIFLTILKNFYVAGFLILLRELRNSSVKLKKIEICILFYNCGKLIFRKIIYGN